MVIANERHKKILLMLRDKGFIRLQELKQELNVSEVTIRKDLDDLQDAGHLQRCHGGALLGTFLQKEQTFARKASEHVETKRKIATYCASLVKTNMTIFLDNGTTIFEIAKRICEIPDITIVTTDIRIAYFFLDSNVDVVMIGGSVQKETGAVVGIFSEQMLKSMRFDLAFFGANAINQKLEVMTPSAGKATVKKKVQINALHSFLTVDSSKFNKQALYQINDLSSYTALITDYKWNQAELELVERKNINIIDVNVDFTDF